MIVLKRRFTIRLMTKVKRNIRWISYFGIIDSVVGGRQKSNLIVCRLKTYQAQHVYGREILPTPKCITNTTNNEQINRTTSDERRTTAKPWSIRLRAADRRSGGSRESLALESNNL